MDAWRDIRRHLEGQDDPTFAEVLAELTPADRSAAGPTWFARALAQSRPAWMADGLCAEPHPGVTWFPTRGEPTEPAKEICRRCLVQEDCLRWAIDHDERGIWGATSARERTAMRQADEAA